MTRDAAPRWPERPQRLCTLRPTWPSFLCSAPCCCHHFIQTMNTNTAENPPRDPQQGTLTTRHHIGSTPHLLICTASFHSRLSSLCEVFSLASIPRVGCVWFFFLCVSGRACGGWRSLELNYLLSSLSLDLFHRANRDGARRACRVAGDLESLLDDMALGGVRLYERSKVHKAIQAAAGKVAEAWKSEGKVQHRSSTHANTLSLSLSLTYARTHTLNTHTVHRVLWNVNVRSNATSHSIV